MNFEHPSREFDDAVAAVCHGTASEQQMHSLNQLLRRNPTACDEYILRVELHSRLASDPDLFVRPDAGWTASDAALAPRIVRPLAAAELVRGRKRIWVAALAACLALLAAAWWGWHFWPPGSRSGATSKAVAMLNQAVDARWEQGEAAPQLGSPLEPGWLRLKSGFAQVVFYSGARVAVEGPAELRIISPNEASCRLGRLTAEVPPEAHGFRIGTPQMNVTDLGTIFGLEVKGGQTELHVFKGGVELQPTGGSVRQTLQGGSGAVTEGNHTPRMIPADPTPFAALFDLQTRSQVAESLRYQQWRLAGARLDQDPGLLVRFDFEHTAASDWLLHNTSAQAAAVPEASIVGCQWGGGRWPAKPALEFRNVSDRVRFAVPGEFECLTLAAWVRVQGLDRQISSLFMSDGFAPGTVHWSIRNDGVLGLTVIGPGEGNYQIVASPPVIHLDELGMWLHLAAVIDGRAGRVVHYVNGLSVGEKSLRVDPPFRIGTAELGNWTARGFAGNDPFLIRNLSGAMDEFCLFSRALNATEIRALYSSGKPQPDPVAALNKN